MTINRDIESCCAVLQDLVLKDAPNEAKEIIPVLFILLRILLNDINRCADALEILAKQGMNK